MINIQLIPYVVFMLNTMICDRSGIHYKLFLIMGKISSTISKLTEKFDDYFTQITISISLEESKNSH